MGLVGRSPTFAGRGGGLEITRIPGPSQVGEKLQGSAEAPPSTYNRAARV